MGEAVDVGRVEARDVEALAERLVEFVKPYQEVVGWASREKQLGAFVGGLLGGTDRKSVELIALAQGVDRRQLQHFVGVSPWDHGPLLGRLQHEVGEEIGDPQGELVVDGSAMPKKGTESVGVARQWCGRLGKVENCQLGVFVAYAGKDSSTLVDERLYLPRAWAFDEERRRKAKVPAAVRFKKPWELADEMLRHVGPRLPHRWIVGDAEFQGPLGRCFGCSASSQAWSASITLPLLSRRSMRCSGVPRTFISAASCSTLYTSRMRSSAFFACGALWSASKKCRRGDEGGRCSGRAPGPRLSSPCCSRCSRRR